MMSVLMWCFKVFCAAGMILGLAAGAADDPVRLSPNGGLRLENEIDLTPRMQVAGGNGVRSFRARAYYRCDQQSPTEVSGVYKMEAEPESPYRNILTRKGDGSYEYEYAIRAPEGINSDRVSLALELDSGKTGYIEMDGKNVELPEKYQNHTLLSRPAEKIRLQIGPAAYTISGQLKCALQDLRKMRKSDSGKIMRLVIQSDGKLNIRREIPSARPVDISAAVNTGFTAPEGWMNQGPGRDLTGLKPGKNRFAGVDFTLVDPAANSGKAALVMAWENPRFAATAQIPLPEPSSARFIHLLHASSHGPRHGGQLGSLQINYTDGTADTIAIRRGVNCGDTWNPSIDYPNAKIGYRQSIDGTDYGLFVSSFPLVPGKTPASLSFKVDKSMWAIAGVSLGDWPVPVNAEPPYVVRAGREWIPITPVETIIPESPLDFSGNLDAPAGKYGRVTVGKNGHFEFERRPGRPVRFLGTNLVQTALRPNQAEADKLVRRLAAEGFNAVRLHAHENQFLVRGADNTLELNLEELDKFDYLISRLKAAGFYLTIDLLGGRPIRPGDRIAEAEQGTVVLRKAIGAISPSALENWKTYARNFLTRKNPYTGLSIAEDPAFIFVITDNEGTILQRWTAGRQPVIEAYHRYLREHQRFTPELAAARTGEFFRFLVQSQRREQREKIRFLKEDLQLKCLVSSINNLSADLRAATLRDDFDLRTFNMYMNHPVFPMQRFRMPIMCPQLSGIGNGFPQLGPVAASRLLGKPCVGTEINWCSPGRYRAEGGPLVGGIAALQGFDGLFSFAWTHHIEDVRGPRPMSTLNLAYDPLNALMWKTIGFLFRRGDVAEASEIQSVTLTPEDELRKENFPADFRTLAGFCRIGMTGRNFPQSARAAGAADFVAALKAGGPAVSSTRELTFYPSRTAMTVCTDRSECITLAQDRLAGRFMSVAAPSTFTTVSLHALDGRPLRESSRMLLFHATDAANSGVSFTDSSMKLQVSNGRHPTLIRRGTARIVLAAPGLKAERLALNGASLGPVKVESSGNSSSFVADIGVDPTEATVCYLITR